MLMILWFGLDQKGTISSYWSVIELYCNKISRNCFNLLLNCLHFSNNEVIEANDRLGKIQPLVDVLIRKYKYIYSQGENVVIDETLVPWRGRLRFRQYIPYKAQKYGIKHFKICTMKAFT